MKLVCSQTNGTGNCYVKRNELDLERQKSQVSLEVIPDFSLCEGVQVMTLLEGSCGSKGGAREGMEWKGKERTGGERPV